ncbi:RNA 2'-phosphotransferase [Stenotrophomonas rhizophila]|uniref:RNA 2'-phosphotransferase n=1 Tax=Stenotrophomonas rhizophila TaxID=216778 RepID=UPI000BA62DC2|nr:RNA 2'-phosphotransferase [Stenotrophomonas rhizophila]PAK92846.1 RNA 2'-phosphotransferase [Stenotrophomonas rhizophila]
MTKQLVETSKFLSYVLRHQPEAIGLTLDAEGWADVDALIAGAASAGRELDRALIQQIVSTNDKKRFTLSDDNSRIRAVQGHSTDSVAIQDIAKVPPALLYHGTATRNLDSILAEGLRPGQRHHVHLSEDTTTATTVGQRYGSPIVLTVDALRMHHQGYTFFQADNGVWLTDHVPTEFVERSAIKG